MPADCLIAWKVMEKLAISPQPRKMGNRERGAGAEGIRVCQWWQQVNISICHRAIMWLRLPAGPKR